MLVFGSCRRRGMVVLELVGGHGEVHHLVEGWLSYRNIRAM